MKRLTLGIIIGVCMISLSMAALFGGLNKNEGEFEFSKKEVQDLQAAGFTNLTYGKMVCDAGECSTLIYVQYEGGITFPVTTITITEGSKSTEDLLAETRSKSKEAILERLALHKQREQEQNSKPLPVTRAEGGDITLKEKK